MGHEIEDMWLDSRETGEIGLVHATAAALGASVVLLTGDDAACAEMTDWDPRVETVPVKRARDRFAAHLLPLPEARHAIETAATAALRAAAGASVTTGAASPASPAAPAQGERPTLAVRWQSASVANTLLGIPGVTLRDSRTVQIRGALPNLFRLLGVFFQVAAATGHQRPYC
jgi:D-amino peptidase